MRAPRFLFFEVALRCNLKCQHCVHWQRKDADDYISDERVDELFAEFADLADDGTIVTCGGEATLAKDRYFHVTRTARRYGLRCLSVTNGTTIKTAKDALRMVDEGPHEITVSIDHCDPQKHDELRGVAGSWHAAVHAIQLLLQVRNAMNPATRVNAMAIVSEHNYRDLDRFYDFALNELGADKLKLNFLQPTFGFVRDDSFFDQASIRDTAALVDILRHCDEKYQLDLDPEFIRVVSHYNVSVGRLVRRRNGWTNAEVTHEPICNTYERNIMVDRYGNAGLCFSRAFPVAPLRKRGDLEKFWVGAHWRNDMKGCTRPCGISHSVRRVSATRRREQGATA